MRALLLLPLLTLTAAAPADERRYIIGSFERLRVQGPYEVELVAGSPGVKAWGTADDLAKLRVRLEGETLIVNTGASGWERRAGEAPGAVRVRIATPRLRAIYASGGAKVKVVQLRAARVDLSMEGKGTMEVAGLRADELVVAHTGFGAMTLAGSAGKVRVRGYGEATLEAGGLLANDAVLVWESRNPLNIGVRYTAQVIASGLGQVTVTGKPECRVSGRGPVACGPPKR